ncbi:LysR substrate-binding domain-containing protein, partial [Klebsiella pneumoniae]
EQYVCVLRDDHPNADGFDLDDFCALDHALVSLGNGSFEGVTDEALAGLGRKRHVVLSVPSFLMLLEILRGSDLIAVVPKRLIQTSDGLRVLD